MDKVTCPPDVEEICEEAGLTTQEIEDIKMALKDNTSEEESKEDYIALTPTGMIEPVKGNPETETKEDYISNQIIEELLRNEADREEEESKQSDIELLGIASNEEGLKHPKCGKLKGRRGRKSLKELREVAGQAKEQKKINDLLHTGKGKSLPSQP